LRTVRKRERSDRLGFCGVGSRSWSSPFSLDLDTMRELRHSKDDVINKYFLRCEPRSVTSIEDEHQRRSFGPFFPGSSTNQQPADGGNLEGFVGHKPSTDTDKSPSEHTKRKTNSKFAVLLLELEMGTDMHRPTIRQAAIVGSSFLKGRRLPHPEERRIDVGDGPRTFLPSCVRSAPAPSRGAPRRPWRRP
jgi:hypothetical protein